MTPHNHVRPGTIGQPVLGTPLLFPWSLRQVKDSRGAKNYLGFSPLQES